MLYRQYVEGEGRHGHIEMGVFYQQGFRPCVDFFLLHDQDHVRKLQARVALNVQTQEARVGILRNIGGGLQEHAVLCEASHLHPRISPCTEGEHLSTDSLPVELLGGADEERCRRDG